jgi:hypothetical protein
MLPIRGAQETGKSSLAKQMERNVAELLPQLRCGRFDFKGDVNQQIEIDALAGSLGLTGAEKLRGVLEQLLRVPKPTVLIFDTYEEAGEDGTWLERRFLAELRRVDWLRVVILGREVPAVRDTVWESTAAPAILLTQPDAQAWFEYSRRLDLGADFDLDFVTRLHRAVAGRPATIRNVFDAGRP